MKKPAIIYVVAIWSFLQTAFYAAMPLRIVGKALELTPETINIILVCGQIISLAIIFGLIQLKNIQRIVTIILLSVASLLVAKILITSIFLNTNYSLKSYIIFSFIFLGNIACIWYLLRAKYIEYSNEYRRYVEQQRLIKISLK